MRWLVLAVLAGAATAAHGQAVVLSACGTGSYPVGQLHQLTMDPAGYLCVSTTTTAASSGLPTGEPTKLPPTPPPEPKK